MFLGISHGFPCRYFFVPMYRVIAIIIGCHQEQEVGTLYSVLRSSIW